MRILPVTKLSLNAYPNVKKSKTNEKITEQELLPTVPFKSAAGNAAKIATGAIAGILLGALTGGLGPILIGGMLGTTGGAFSCKSEDKDEIAYDDHSDQYYP